MLTCSSGGNDPRQEIELKKIGGQVGTFGNQIYLAETVKKAVPDLLIGAVGVITDPKQANAILEEKKADIVLLARQIQREPYFPLRAGRELGLDIGWPGQIGWGSKLAVGLDDRTLHIPKSKL